MVCSTSVALVRGGQLLPLQLCSQIEEIIEPTPEVANLKRFPELDDELRVLNFIVVVLGKPQMRIWRLARIDAITEKRLDRARQTAIPAK